MENRNVLVVPLIVVVLAIGKLLCSLAIKFIGDDLKAWLPVIVARILERAVRQIEFGDRAFFRQHWQSRLDETPGDLSKFIIVLIFYREAIRRIRHRNHIPSRFRRYGVTAFLILAVAICIPVGTSPDGNTSAVKIVEYVLPLSSPPAFPTRYA